MAKLEINGHQVEVDDSFLSLSPDQQNATVDEIAKSLGAPKAQEGTSTTMDMLKSAGSGVAQGAMDLVGLPGTIQNAFDSSLSKVTGDIASLWGGKGMPAPPPSPLSGAGLREIAAKASGGATEYKPQTTAGEYAQTAGEFVPGAIALGGGGGIMGNALKFGVAPGLASEGAGQLAEKYAPAAEPYARFGAALLTPMAISGVQSLIPSAAKTENASVAKLAEALKADGLDPASARAKLNELGPEGMIGDLGPNLQGQTAALANMPGRGNEIVRTALNERQAGANARLQEARAPLGAGVVPSAVNADIKAGQRALGPLYDQVFDNAKAVDTKPIADVLESAAVNLRGEAQNKIREVRKMLDITGADQLDPNPGTLFQTRQAIDGMLKTETNDKVIQALSPVRQQIDDALAAAVPDIKKVDAAYAELARQKSALERGQTVLDSGRTAPRPSELADEVAAGALPKGEQMGPSAVPFRLSQGAAADIDRILGNNANDIAAMNRIIKGEGDWNRAKLTTLFGEDKANRLIRVLDNEKTFAATRDFALGNSATAGRQQAQKSLGGRDTGMSVKEYYGAGGILGAIRGAGIKMTDKLASVLANKNIEARNNQLAKYLVGKERDAVISALVKQQGAPKHPDAREAAALAALLLGKSTSPQAQPQGQ